jgi:bile acid:Na+ symporter, BASS family
MKVMSKIKHLLRNRNFILFLALCVGLILPQLTLWTKPLTLPALAFAMTLSTMGVSGSVFRSPRSLMIPALLGIFMNYAVLTSVILATSTLLIHEKEIWSGFVILAATPPAVAVVPFTEFLKGNNTYSLIGSVGAYLAALIIIPLITIELLGAGIFDPYKVLIIMAELIMAPFILSRILIWQKIDKKLESTKGILINWSFFVVVYTLVGLNRDVFVNQPFSLIPAAVIAISSTFLLGWIIERVGKAWLLAVSSG